MKELKKILGLQIRRIRKTHNFTQEQFAEIVDIEIPTLSNIETGKNTASLQTIINVIEKFQIEPNDFFSFVRYKKQQKDPLDIEINQRVKLLPNELKSSLLNILEYLK